MSDPREGRLAGKIALVTGTSRGIGAAVANSFAAEGAQLVCLARTVGGLEELDDAICAAGGLKPLLVPHDLRQLDGLDQLGASLYERYGRLDIVVGNAAQLGVLSPMGHVPPNVWNDTFTINVTANYRLLRSLDPLLRRSKAGRAIFVTDQMAHKAAAYWGCYAASKAALETMVRSYAAELANSTVAVNLIRPFPVRTALRAQAFPGEDDNSLPAPELLAHHFVELALPSWASRGQCIELSPPI